MLVNYYNILGITHNASISEIKKAFRIKAKLCHPDVNKSFNAKAAFQLINEAYQILVDVEKRKQYDYKWKTRYGNTFQNKAYGGQKTQNTNYYKAYTNSNIHNTKSETPIERTQIDRFLFITLFILGGVSVIMGILSLIYREYKGIDNLSGLLMGIWMLILLFAGWNFIIKENKK
ncbi:MAG: J domain-containing protein [Bacteroidales bacterium]|nr:J domain-containing protein [Bacteroidales bacterium]